ncbi:MAG TPA: tRNA (N(6)-L-threonylcarbamoyladenosine(37)-C(2))-methylthiotransferase [Methanothrix sp.]|nr:tRNA (N(6)-L-threonylcarbamoyladenosine(37)-C(2))-methylthiotransferase [Methanothrix sp.]
MKFYIETFGCTSNFGNSQEAAAALIGLGHEPAPLEDADAVIVNTCAVTSRTERKILRRLTQLQGERLIVAGCLAASLPGSLRGIACRGIVGLLCRQSAEEVSRLLSRPQDLPARQVCRLLLQDRTGIINIAEGCSGACTYCIVRRARGRLASKCPGDVVEEAHLLASAGAAEIQLSAQDTASYGSDMGGCLPELVSMVAAIPGEFMVRVGMMNPDTLLPHIDEMIEVLQGSKVFRFLHIPLQSGSNEVLERMGRRYTAQDFSDIVKALRSSVPDISVNTDVICGFPGETEEDFQETVKLVEAVQPDKVNVTRFSPRPGTAAARLYDMPDRIKKDRSRQMTALWTRIAADRNRRYEGRTLYAWVTERGTAGTMKARAANYTGIVFSATPDSYGWRRIRIARSNPFYLEGILQL